MHQSPRENCITDLENYKWMQVYAERTISKYQSNQIDPENYGDDELPLYNQG